MGRDPTTPASAGSLIARTIDRLIQWRWLLALLALVLATAAWPLAQRLTYDRSIENMFAPGDPLVATYGRFKQVFGGDLVVLAVYEDPQLWSEAGLRRATELTTRLEKVPGVRAALSPATLDRLLGRLGTSILDSDNKLSSRYRQMFAGYTHSSDGKVAAVACILERAPIAGDAMQATIAQMRSIINDLPGGIVGHGVLVGEPVLVSDGFRYVEQDGKWLGWVSTSLLALTIIVCLRSLRWVAIAILVVQWTILVTQGALALSGVRLSMVSSMLTALVTVIGVATVMHLAVAYRDNCRRGLAPRLALGHAGHVLGAPIFWACFTDAIGFLSLLIADVGPVRDFGLMMALASLLVIPAVAAIAAALTLAGRSPGSHPHAMGQRRLEHGLIWLGKVVLGHPRRVAALVLVILLWASIGAWRLDVETDFTRNFRRGSPIAQAYSFVEDRLGGAGVWDIVVPAPAVLTQAYLQRIRELEERLRALPASAGSDEPALTKVLSIVDALDAAEQQPVLAALPVELRMRGIQAIMPEFVASLEAQDPHTGQRYLRIMLRSPDRRDAQDKQRLINEVQRVARQAFGPGGTEPVETAEAVETSNSAAAPPPSDGAQVTGYYVLLTNLVVSMLRDQWLCFAATIAGVGLTLAVALRRGGWALAALASNVFPIVLVLGLLGWSGLRLNMGAAMIAAVSMGLSVDSSIHFLFAYRRALQAGSPQRVALAQAQQSVGRALVFATLALMIGFGALSFSQFVPTVYFGVLGSLSLFGGLIGNLVLLPILLLPGLRGSRD